MPKVLYQKNNWSSIGSSFMLTDTMIEVGEHRLDDMDSVILSLPNQISEALFTMEDNMASINSKVRSCFGLHILHIDTGFLNSILLPIIFTWVWLIPDMCSRFFGGGLFQTSISFFLSICMIKVIQGYQMWHKSWLKMKETSINKLNKKPKKWYQISGTAMFAP